MQTVFIFYSGFEFKDACARWITVGPERLGGGGMHIGDELAARLHARMKIYWTILTCRVYYHKLRIGMTVAKGIGKRGVLRNEREKREERKM